MTDKIETVEEFLTQVTDRVSVGFPSPCLEVEYEKLALTIKDRDEAMQLKGKRAVLHELLELADCFVLGSEPPYEKAWEVLNAKYSTTPKEVKIGSKWQGYKMNARVISVVDNGVNYWHTHHDGTRSVYRTTLDFFKHNCTWIEDPHEIVPKSIWRDYDNRALEVEVQEVHETYVSYFPTSGGLVRNIPSTEWYVRFIWVKDA